MAAHGGGSACAQPGPYPQPVQSVQQSSERLIRRNLFVETYLRCQSPTCFRSTAQPATAEKSSSLPCRYVCIFAPYTAPETGGSSRHRAEHPRNSSTAADGACRNAESCRLLLLLPRCPGHSSPPKGPPARKQTCRARIQGVGLRTRGYAPQDSCRHARPWSMQLDTLHSSHLCRYGVMGSQCNAPGPSRLCDRRNSSRTADSMQPH